MAEVVGVIASAITFGTIVAQLGSSINKLKNYWDELRDAPEDLQWLIRDIEVFAVVLAEIEADIAQESLASSLVNCKPALQSFKFCHEAAGELELLARDLGKDIDGEGRGKRAIARVKMVMKKKKLERYKVRLTNVTRLLLLSQQCYTRALIQVQPELIASRIAKTMSESMSLGDSQRAIEQSDNNIKTPSPTVVEPLSSHRAEPNSMVRRKRPSVQSYKDAWRFQAPSWITNKALELASIRAPDGWKFTFRAYRIFSPYSEVALLIINNNIEGLQQLFALKKASPFDKSSLFGYSLFHLVVSAEMIEFLLDQGGDATAGDDFNNTALDEFVRGWNFIPLNTVKSRTFPVIRTLLSRSEYPIYDTEEEILNDLIYAMIGKDTLTREDLEMNWYFGYSGQDITIVHSVARKIGTILALLSRRQKRKAWLGRYDQQLVQSRNINKQARNREQANDYDREEAENWKRRFEALYKSWSRLFCEFIAVGIDMHRVVENKTPFCAFLSGYHQRLDPYNNTLEYDVALKRWLADLRTAGIDLSDFGAREHSLHQRRRFSHPFRSHPSHSEICIKLWIIDFTYGPSPEDWHLSIFKEMDICVGDFWKLVEKQQEIMPGAWPEDQYYKF